MRAVQTTRRVQEHGRGSGSPWGRWTIVETIGVRLVEHSDVLESSLQFHFGVNDLLADYISHIYIPPTLHTVLLNCSQYAL